MFLYRRIGRGKYLFQKRKYTYYYYTHTTNTLHLFIFPLLADYHYDAKDPDQDYADMQAVILRSLGLKVPAAGVGAAPEPPE